MSDCEAVSRSLTDKQAGRLLKAIVAHLGGRNTAALLDTPQLKVAFEMIKGRLDGDTARRERNALICRKNGTRGGRPRKTGKTHAETQPIEKATALQPATGGGDQENQSGFSETKAVIEKPKRFLKNQSGFCPLQEAENQSDIKTALVFDEKTPGKTGKTADESKKEVSPTPPIRKNNNIYNSLSQRACAREGGGDAVDDIDKLERQLLESSAWIGTVCMNRGLSQEQARRYIADFCSWLRETETRESLQDARRHFVNQLPYIQRKFNNNTGNANYQASYSTTTTGVGRTERAAGYAATIASLAQEDGGGLAPLRQRPRGADHGA